MGPTESAQCAYRFPCLAKNPHNTKLHAVAAQKLGHLGPPGALKNRADFSRGERAACKLLKTMKSSVSSRLKPANSGPSVAQQACQGHCAEGHLARQNWRTGNIGESAVPGLIKLLNDPDRTVGVSGHLGDARKRRFDALAVWELDGWAGALGLHQQHPGVDCFGV